MLRLGVPQPQGKGERAVDEGGKKGHGISRPHDDDLSAAFLAGVLVGMLAAALGYGLLSPGSTDTIILLTNAHPS